MSLSSHPIKPEAQLDFVVAGKAIFTIKNKKTQGRFTYKVSTPADKQREGSTIRWVSVLSGEDNSSSYTYIGCLFLNQGFWSFRHGAKSRISAQAPSVVAFQYVFNNVISVKRSHPDLEVWHEGKCSRCGRKLTVPESIETGMGPECASIKANYRQYLA